MPEIDPSRIYIYKDKIIYLSKGIDRMPQRGITMAGVNIGKIEGKIFAPHHQFFSACGTKLPSYVELGKSKDLIEAYLRGEEIRLNDEIRENARLIDKSFGAILLAGVPVGGFKYAGGKLKNHYPKGLRNMR